MITTINATVLVNAPLLVVFDYIADPSRLPEWLPFYSQVRAPNSAVGEAQTRPFEATLSVIPEALRRLPLMGLLPPEVVRPTVTVEVDDLVLGRRIAYRSTDTGWTTLCDFKALGGGTVLSMTQSVRSPMGLLWSGPWQVLAEALQYRVLDGLKQRLENRAFEGRPIIFFSYRRSERFDGGRLFDALTAELGPGSVFRDVNSLWAGRSWRADISTAIKGCALVISHIGDTWEKRLRDASNGPDVLRQELELAIEHGRTILPVITSARDNISVAERMGEIAKTPASKSVAQTNLGALHP